VVLKVKKVINDYNSIATTFKPLATITTFYNPSTNDNNLT